MSFVPRYQVVFDAIIARNVSMVLFAVCLLSVSVTFLCSGSKHTEKENMGEVL